MKIGFEYVENIEVSTISMQLHQKCVWWLNLSLIERGQIYDMAAVMIRSNTEVAHRVKSIKTHAVYIECSGQACSYPK